MKVLPFGDVALLVEVDGLPEVLALAAAVRTARPAGVLDVVPAARTVLLTVGPGTDLAALRRTVLDLPVDPASVPEGETVEIPVTYDGPDLAEVARLTGAGRVGGRRRPHRHPVADRVRRVRPGLRLPDRRGRAVARCRAATSRAPRCRPAPSGWPGSSAASTRGRRRGVGSSSARPTARLWDPDRDPPALLEPGGWVRFVVAAGMNRALEGAGRRPVGPRAGPGRPGSGRPEVGRSGAADRAALTLANRLVANDEGAAAVEVLLGGLAVRAASLLTVALAGARGPGVGGRHAGRPPRRRQPAPGAVLRLAAPPTGLRTYLAVRGGIDVAPVLGSRSTDTLSEIGPPPLRPGDVLPVGPEPAALPVVDVAPVPPPPGRHRRAARPSSARAPTSSPTQPS
jgi:hypothetical protein